MSIQGIHIKEDKAYSSLQNGKEEPSHRKDQKILYQGNIITSENELKRGRKSLWAFQSYREEDSWCSKPLR